MTTTTTDLAHVTVAINAADVWDVTVLAYNTLWVCHITNMTADVMLAITVSDAKGGKAKLRGMCKEATRNANKMYSVLSTYGQMERICSRDEFLAIAKWAKATHKRNYGEVAEQLLRDFYGLPMYWHKDSTPGTVAGDMEVDGIQIQHKHQNATFAH